MPPDGGTPSFLRAPRAAIGAPPPWRPYHREVAQARTIEDRAGAGTSVPAVEEAARRHRKHRRRLFAVLLALIVAVGGWWLASDLDASGDPGGAILHQLTPAASALPGYGTAALPWSGQPSLSAPYLTEFEPHRDSCDGMAGTQGWSQVGVQGSFRWSGTHEALFTEVTAGLSSLGWRRTTIPGNADEALWKKHLDNGTTATAALNLSPLGDPTWEFVVLAPPAGRAASGC